MGALTYADNKIFNVANSYNLGTVKDLSGDKAQFNANDTYTNVAYNSENGIAAAEEQQVLQVMPQPSSKIVQ